MEKDLTKFIKKGILIMYNIEEEMLSAFSLR